MGTITGAVRRVVRSGRGLLPSGQLLTPKVWERRHRGIVWLLWLHVAGLAAFAVVRGYGLLHGLQEASLVAAFAVPAAHPAFARRARSTAAVLGLITASAVIVHLSGGVIEAHFHFFVMIRVITLYQDWLPFGLALGYVVVHHSVLGLLDPHGVFNHEAALRSPWQWALIHGAFVLGASVACLVNWRLSERQAVEISRLVSRLEGLAAPTRSPGCPTGGSGRRSCPGSWSGPGAWAPGLRGHDRPGQLQGLQRQLRPPGRRPGAQGGGQRLAGRCALHRPAGPLRRGGVRAPAAGVRAGGRHSDRGATAGRHPPGDLFGRPGLLGFPGGRGRADRARR